MSHLRTGSVTRVVRRALLLAALTAGAAPAMALTPSSFTPTNPIGGAPIGFTYAGNMFVGTILGDGTNRLYSTDLSGGSIAPFGGSVSLLPGYGQEHYVSASLGQGGFPMHDIYVASGNNIQHITNAGVADAGLFISSSTPLNDLVRGIMFDNIGTFGYQMIITTHAGGVYTVNSGGFATLIASTGEDTEGLDIAPVGAGAHWGSLDGALFVASEGTGNVRAIKPGTFSMSLEANIPSAEQLAFVPLNLGSNPLEGMYSAAYPNEVVKIPGSQFSSMIGDMIITGETTTKVWDVTAPFTATNVGNIIPQPEDGVFVTADMINSPEPASLALLACGGLTLMMRPRKRIVR